MIGRPKFLSGVQIVRTKVGDWETHALVVVFIDGGPPLPLCFLDPEALELIHEQTGLALREAVGDGLDPGPVAEHTVGREAAPSVAGRIDPQPRQR